MFSIAFTILRNILLPMLLGIAGAFVIAVLAAPKHESPLASIDVLPSPLAATTTQATSTKKIQTTAEKPKPKVTTTEAAKAKVDPVLAMKQALLSRIVAGDILSEAAVNEEVRKAVVNIYCTSPSDALNPLSASGVIVSKGGLVLTNAHVAQYVLLTKHLSCVARTGSPASPTYTLGVAYFPEIWLNENAAKITEENPTSTGEHDYAFLAITGMVTPGVPLPDLPFVAPEWSDVVFEGTPMVLAAYPAGFLGGLSVATNLWLTSSVGDIWKLYYFTDPAQIDLFSTNGNIVSQKGASGGAAVSLLSGKLLGMLTTVSEAETTGGRELMALTLPYIARNFEKQEGYPLATFMEQSPLASVLAFENKRKAFSDRLLKVLIK